MKKLLFFCLALIVSNFFIYKTKGILVNRNTFFENVMGVQEPEFQKNENLIENSIKWDAGQNSFFLKNVSNNKLFRAGKFEAFSIGKLRNLTKDKKVSSTPGSFNVVEALSPLGKSYYEHVDIGANQAKLENRDAVFQVASNFNALELTSAHDPMKDITGYIGDMTQGPFASISAAPGTILRHYYMFYEPSTNPSTWQQYAILYKLWQKSDAKKQINLLENTDIPIVNSYVAFDERSPSEIKNYNVENIEVGWHEGIQVTSGLMPSRSQHTLVDDPRQIINQVFTAAVDFGSNYAYSENPTAIAIAQAIQDAAYEGTIRVAVAHNKKKVILTLIGGGVFYNKLAWIANAIEKMKDFIIASGVDVTLIIFDGNNPQHENQINEFRTRMQQLVQDTKGKYRQYSDDHASEPLIIEKAPAKVTPPSEVKKPATQSSEARKSIDRNTFFEYIIGTSENNFQKDDNLKKNTISADRFGSFILANFKAKKQFDAGRFKAFSIGELRNLTSKKVSSTPGKFNVVEALDPIVESIVKSYYQYVDISTLQANRHNQNVVFQVASGTNALELTSQTDSMDNITSYIHNPTQGPVASVCAAPGLILRHYYMFYSSKTKPSSWQQQAIPNKIWEKSDANKQLNLLENTDIPVVNSYIILDEKNITQIKNYKVENIQIGWHEKIQVPFILDPGTNQYKLVDDPLQRINQVFTAALDFETNYSYKNDATAIAIAQALQDAAYEGTIRATAAHNFRKVFLTLLGSATFSNKLEWIANALEKMKDFIISSGTDVTLIIFNGNAPYLRNQIAEFRRRMKKLAEDTKGMYVQYSEDNPRGQGEPIIEPSKPVGPEPSEELPGRRRPPLEHDKKLLDALYNLTKELRNLQRLLQQTSIT